MSNATRPADNIRAEMARRRLSQIELAQVLGRSQASVSRRLTGATPFDVAELVAVARWLGVPASRLLDDDTSTGDAA